MEDNEIFNILKNGSKFRLIPQLNKDIVRKEIIKSVEEYIYKVSFRLNIHLGYFSEWKAKLLNSIFNRITNIQNNYPYTINYRKFSNKIKSLQDKYVIMPVDKASNNFGFVCKRFYATVLISEINSNNVFEQYSGNINDIKNVYEKILKEYKIVPAMYNIPYVYGLPKFHKNPISFRFITSSYNCISKNVSIFLNLALDKVMEAVSLESEYNWIIKNNNSVLEKLNIINIDQENLNDFKIATFDFSTLFTTLPHDDLIRNIVALLNKYFSSDIIIYFRNKKVILTKSKFVEILKFV